MRYRPQRNGIALLTGWQHEIASRAQRDAMLGNKHSKDQKFSPERNAKISTALTGRKQTPEHIANKSSALRAYTARRLAGDLNCGASLAPSTSRPPAELS
jgi:hypothetical protein